MYDKIYNAIKKAVDSGVASGVNFLALKNGREIISCQYGYRDIENQKPMTRNTILRMYSTSKPVTAAAAMLLVSRGIVDIGEDISAYLPEFKNMHVNKNGRRVPVQRPITVKNLLNMTSGLPYPDENTAGGRQCSTVFWNLDNRLYTDKPMTTKEFSELIAENDLCFDPGERFMYGVSADILGALIERTTDMKLGEFTLDIPPAFESGGAGICSTLDDYSKFAEMLLGNGNFRGRQIIPEKAVKYMISGGLTDIQKADLQAGWGDLYGYTYGNMLRVCEDESKAVVLSAKGEYGWNGWLGTYFSNEPAYGITVLMGVQRIGGDTGVLVRKLKNIVMCEAT